MKIIFAHYCETQNVGDLASGPYYYFKFPGARVVSARKPIPTDARVVIFGGGTVAAHAERFNKERPNVLTIAWGVGRTRHGETKPGPAPGGFLFGSRDWGQPGAVYAPCASCMLESLDSPVPITNEFGLFLNADPSIARRYPVEISGLPTLYNRAGLMETIHFLGSAQTIVTNSYHGAYWATLLGRRVVVVGAYSSKFHNFKFKPVILESVNRQSSRAGFDWHSAAKWARPYPQALADARAATIAFHSRVVERIALL